MRFYISGIKGLSSSIIILSNSPLDKKCYTEVFIIFLKANETFIIISFPLLEI